VKEARCALACREGGGEKSSLKLTLTMPLPPLCLCHFHYCFHWRSTSARILTRMGSKTNKQEEFKLIQMVMEGVRERTEKENCVQTRCAFKKGEWCSDHHNKERSLPRMSPAHQVVSGDARASAPPYSRPFSSSPFAVRGAEAASFFLFCFFVVAEILVYY
jgi:hypothetical protein